MVYFIFIFGARQFENTLVAALSKISRSKPESPNWTISWTKLHYYVGARARILHVTYMMRQEDMSTIWKCIIWSTQGKHWNPIKKRCTCKNSEIIKSYLYLRSVLTCSRPTLFQACRVVLAGLSLLGDPSYLIFLWTLGDHAAPEDLPGPVAHEHLKP